MQYKIKHLLIGSPLSNEQSGEKRLNKIRALAAFSPDALSSIAYANQEIYLGLIVAGAAGLSLSLPIGLTIAGLLIIVAISYYQTIHGYPQGGGSYIVTRENLGRMPSLIAGAAILVDYLLTAAVSITAGVEALASAFPVLWGHRVLVSLGILLVITLINLRGLKEAGTFMTMPVYLFLFTYLPLLAYGAVRLFIDGPRDIQAVAPAASQPLAAFLILRAFASGCTALTGIEAISDGVPAFRPPQAKNAGKTLAVMAVLMFILFVGSISLIYSLAVVAGPQETILSALARRLLGSGPLYILIQASTMLILTVAANTSYADFPRVASFLARDGFLPRQLANLGDRLVFSNGILLLAAGTAALIIAFQGDTHSLVPLFAIGAFLAFTLSQSSMVMHWMRERGPNWKIKAFANGAGAIATGTTLLVVAVSKFQQGAWLTILVIPTAVIIFLRIHAHYQTVAAQLTLRGLPPSLKPQGTMRAVIPVSGVHRGMIDAVLFAQTIARQVTGVYIELNPEASANVQKMWQRWFPDIPLVVLPSPYRSIVEPLLKFLDETDREHNDGQMAVVVLPEFVPARWWQSLLHNQTSRLIKNALLYSRREKGYQRVIIDVPYHLKR
ncbi:MAG TPA: APC family permease [Anaerolineales bacterium]|nr:APC family permease [Anaerolineales bacterium]